MKTSQTSGKTKATKTKSVKSPKSPKSTSKPQSKIAAKPKTVSRKTKSKTSEPKLATRSFVTSGPLPPPPVPPAPRIPMPRIPLFQVPRRSKPTKKSSEFDEDSIQNYQQLIAALKAKKVQITLGNNIIAPDNISINYDVAINLNGHSIISEESTRGARVLDIHSGEVTLTGKGNIFAMGSRSVAIRVFGAISTEISTYTTLTVDEEVSIFAPDSYGILASPSLGVAYGLTINFSGKIFARDGICLAGGIHGRDRHLPVINIRSSASIIADENFGAAAEASGFGHWHIGAAKLTGATGLSAKAGIIDLSHTRIIASGEASHAAIMIVEGEAGNLDLTVDGGAYVSEASHAISGETETLKSFTIKGGDFCGVESALHDDIEDAILVEAGTFDTDVAEFLEKLDPKIELLPEPIEPLPNPALDAPLPPELCPPATPEPEPEPEPIPEPEPEIDPVALEQAERLAIKTALTEAIIDLRRLKPEDYDVGFSNFQAVITRTDLILANENITLSDIRDAAADLLDAFDGLEERNELSLSDDELDQLFYHGAVLEEVASKHKRFAKFRSKSKLKKVQAEPKLEPSAVKTPELAERLSSEPEPTKSADFASEPIEPLPNPALDAPLPLSVPVPDPVALAFANAPELPPEPLASAPLEPEPKKDLSLLSDIVGLITDLNAADYTASSYDHLLTELARAKTVIANPTSAQSEIDEISFSLLGELSDLEPILTSAPSPLTPAKTPSTSLQSQIPQPPQGTIQRIIFIDEATPNPFWSTGVAQLDENSPVINQSPLTNSRPNHLKNLSRSALAPFTNLAKSFAIGARAGLAAYRKTRQTAKAN